MILSNLDKKAALSIRVAYVSPCDVFTIFYLRFQMESQMKYGEYIAGDYKILRMDKRPAQRIKEREYEHIQCSDNDRWLGHVPVWNGCDGRWPCKVIRR